VQTSIDGGSTWVDIAQCHFALASLREGYNLSGLVAVGSATTFTDGTLASNTSVGGILGNRYRVTYATTGTYAGNTTLNVDVQFGRLMRSRI
jgi:hypothetical protein